MGMKTRYLLRRRSDGLFFYSCSICHTDGWSADVYTAHRWLVPEAAAQAAARWLATIGEELQVVTAQVDDTRQTIEISV